MPKKPSGGKSRLRSAAAASAAPPRGRIRPAGEAESTLLLWFKAALGVLLLPVCYVTTQTFLGAFGETSAETGLIRSAPIWFFFVGAALWLIAFFGLPRPLYLYVLGHELTHAAFVLLCGGKITAFKVHPEGGHIVTNRNNILISLSPYFIPFYSLVALGVFGLLGMVIDLSAYHPNSLFWGHIGFSPSWLLYVTIGVTWCFHLTFTGWMIFKNQPDLRQNGTFFSLTVIYVVNLLVLSAMVVFVSKQVNLHEFLSAWVENAKALASKIL